MRYLHRPLTFYQMDKKPVGKALIINNKEFYGLPTRRGSDRDEGTVWFQSNISHTKYMKHIKYLFKIY